MYTHHYIYIHIVFIGGYKRENRLTSLNMPKHICLPGIYKICHGSTGQKNDKTIDAQWPGILIMFRSLKWLSRSLAPWVLTHGQMIFGGIENKMYLVYSTDLYGVAVIFSG